MLDANGKVLPKKFAALVEEWKVKKEGYREEFGHGWPAKLVHTDFTYKGKEYSLTPEMFAKEGDPVLDCWEEGLMECFQHDLKMDLIALGADQDKIYNMGFLD